MSADGNYIVISNPRYNPTGKYGTDIYGSYSYANSGAEYGNVAVWKRSGTTWTYQRSFRPTIAKVLGTHAVQNVRFGQSVAINSDGTYLAVSASLGNLQNVGDTAYDSQLKIYKQVSANNWTEQASFAPDAAGTNNQTSCAMTNDGNYAALSTSGKLYFYTRSGGSSWTLDTTITNANIDPATAGLQTSMSFGGTNGNWLLAVTTIYGVTYYKQTISGFVLDTTVNQYGNVSVASSSTAGYSIIGQKYTTLIPTAWSYTPSSNPYGGPGEPGASQNFAPATGYHTVARITNASGQWDIEAKFQNERLTIESYGGAGPIDGFGAKVAMSSDGVYHAIAHAERGRGAAGLSTNTNQGYTLGNTWRGTRAGGVWVYKKR
jgi:hypothetical protein